MKTYSSESGGRIVVIRFNRGDLLLEGIKEAIKKEDISDGVVVSGIGTLDQATLHMIESTDFPPKEAYPVWKDKPLELVSISGLIADGVPHLHTLISDKERTYAGHLENNCKVLFLAEVVIYVYTNLQLHRLPNEEGIPALELK
jgi:uncharacterized protein